MAVSSEIPIIPRSEMAAVLAEAATVPRLAGAGEQAAQRFLEFFAVTLRNTRSAYIRACESLFAGSDTAAAIDELVDIEPIHAAAHSDQKTRKLYHRSGDEVSLDAIKRIKSDWTVV